MSWVPGTIHVLFGNTTQVTDPLNNVTTYTYNKLNQLVTETQVGGWGSRSYLRDAVGNVRRLTDRNGRVTTWNYDPRDRLISETGTSGSIVYGYDSADRLTSVTDNHFNAPDFMFTYDSRGQLQNELQSHTLINAKVAFDRDYDTVGNQTKLAANIGGTITSGGAITGGVWDFSNTYNYDGMNRLTSVVQAGVSGGNAVAPKLASFTYNAASQLTDLRRYAATSASAGTLKVHSRYGYDLAGRLTSITHGKAEITAGQTWTGTSSVPASLGTSNMLAAYFLKYDADNRVTSFSSWRDAFKTTYTYDVKDQLTSATSTQIVGMSLPFPLPASESYNFDAGGNRLSSSGATQSASGSHNRLQTDSTFNYIYDNEGNVTRRTRIVGGQVTDYTWDHRNRLRSVIDRVSAGGTKTQQVEYIYDAFNQLTGKRVSTQFDTSGAPTNWSRYEVFAWADGQEVFRFVDSDGQGAQPARIANRYLWGAAVDQLLADEQFVSGLGPAINATAASSVQGETLWALSDHLGSVRDLVDNNGVIREHKVYDSFGRFVREVDYNASGQVISSTNPEAVDTVFGYTGRLRDGHTGLQYNRARWYDPATGRWLSQDPISFAGGDANLYRYVGNGPVDATDPNGLWEEPIKDSRGRYITGGGWDVNGFIVVNGYEVRSNWPGYIMSLPLAYVIWPLAGGGTRVNPPPRKPGMLDLEGSRKARQIYQEQFVSGLTGCSRASPPLPESELKVIATLVTVEGEFIQLATGLPSPIGILPESSIGRGICSKAPVRSGQGPFGYPSGTSIPSAPKGLVNVTEEASDRLGRWFARYGDDGAETFSARLLNGTDELGVAWTDDITQLAGNIAEIQGAIGRNIPKITGMASDGIEAAIKAGRFNSDLYAKHLARRMGGQWRIDVVKRAGEDVWDIIATRIGN